MSSIAPTPPGSRKVLEAEWLAADDHLRDALVTFATQTRFEDEFMEAASQFWGVDTLDDLPFEPTEETPEFLLTFEWFLYDYEESTSERRIVDLFAQVEGSRLPALERELLEHWRQATLSPYEVVSVQEGTGYTVQGLLDGATFTVDEPPTSKELQPGDLIVARLLPAGSVYRPSSVFRTYGQADLPRLVATVRDFYAQFQADVPDADFITFLHEQGFLFNDYTLERQALADRMASQTDGAADPPADDGDEFEPPDPAAAAATLAWLEREYNAWIDRPTPALGGRSPRAAAADPEGRRKVTNFLCAMGSIEASYALVGEPAFEVTRLRTALGIVAGGSA